MPIGPVMLDIEGTSLTDEDRSLLAHPLVGGIIYFSRNFQSAEQIQQLSQDIRKVRPDILIAVDQEGGRVQRFKDGFTRLPAMQRFLPLYQRNAEAALALVKDCGWLMAVELIAVGVDFSFAPVLDLDDNKSDVIGDRSFSKNPHETCALAQAFMAGMAEAGMSATGKHFPGHGSVKADSHLELPIDEREFATIEQHDLIPFQQLLPQLSAVMPAHIIFSNIDNKPVGFSQHWLKTILREQLDFQGVVFSDDLSMEGAAFAGSYGARAHTALSAGCDMALICNNREGAIEALEFLEEQEGYLASLASSPNGLTSMSASLAWSRESLITLPRYQKTRAVLSALTSSAA